MSIKGKTPPEERGSLKKGEKYGYKASRMPSKDVSPTTRTDGGLS